MTPGRLIISAPAGRCTLYTYHSARNIPGAVNRAVSVLARNLSYIDETTEAGAEKALRHNVWATDRLLYASGAAALIIAAEPCLLEPKVPKNGSQNAYHLLITENYDWLLTWNEVACKPAAIFNAIDRLAYEIAKRNRRRLKAKGRK